MRSICTSYGMYFNKKYSRIGPLFQGIFKAIDIDNENYLLWLNRYIHRNHPEFRTYPYSSYQDYLGQRQTSWINTKLLLDFFSGSSPRQAKNFQEFVDDNIEEPGDLPFLLLEN